jgi:hypothetical protein
MVSCAVPLHKNLHHTACEFEQVCAANMKEEFTPNRFFETKEMCRPKKGGLEKGNRDVDYP